MLDNREKTVVDNAKSIKCCYQMGRAYPVMVNSRQKHSQKLEMPLPKRGSCKNKKSPIRAFSFWDIMDKKEKVKL